MHEMPPQIWAIRADDGSNCWDWWGYRKPWRSTYSIYSLRSPRWREPVLLWQVVEFVFWIPNIYVRTTNPQLYLLFSSYNNHRCKSYQKAKKKLMILEGPNILTVVLKRFEVKIFILLSLMVSTIVGFTQKNDLCCSCSLITLGSWVNPSIFPSFSILAHIWVTKIMGIIPCTVSTQWWSI